METKVPDYVIDTTGAILVLLYQLGRLHPEDRPLTNAIARDLALLVAHISDSSGAARQDTMHRVSNLVETLVGAKEKSH